MTHPRCARQNEGRGRWRGDEQGPYILERLNTLNAIRSEYSHPVTRVFSSVVRI